VREDKRDGMREGDGERTTKPVDQTESNNSRGITSLAHGSRSHPEETPNVRKNNGERSRWEEKREI